MDNSIQAPTETIRRALSAWPAWCDEPPRLQRQLGGLSNHSYLVSAADNQFVIRINARIPALAVDRAREKNVLVAIQAQPFSPSIIYWHKDYLITKYVEHEESVGKQLEQSPNLMAKLFSKIHQTPYSSNRHLDPWKLIETYQINLNQQKSSLSKPRYGDRHALEVQQLLDESAVKIQLLKPNNFQLSAQKLCHNDLLRANILCTQDNQVVIDWEYAQLGNPVYDLAVYAETCQLNENRMTQLLDCYRVSNHLTPAKAISMTDLILYRLVYRFIELLWWHTNSNRQLIIEQLVVFQDRLKTLSV